MSESFCPQEVAEEQSRISRQSLAGQNYCEHRDGRVYVYYEGKLVQVMSESSFKGICCLEHASGQDPEHCGCLVDTLKAVGYVRTGWEQSPAG